MALTARALMRGQVPVAQQRSQQPLRRPCRSHMRFNNGSAATPSAMRSARGASLAICAAQRPDHPPSNLQRCTQNSTAQQAAVGLAPAALAAAVLAGPADAAQLQLLLPPAQQQSIVSVGSTTRSAELAPQRQSSLEAAADAHLADLSLADLSLPHFDGLPRLGNAFQVLGFLLNHPVAALLVGGGLAVVVPRLVRAGVRLVLVPAAALLLLYVSVRNPGFVWGGVSGAVSAVVAHPVATSAAILAASSLLLSPYILIAGAAAVLVSGTRILPGFMRPALPGPVNEALRQVDMLQGQTRSALEQLAAAVQPAPALKDGKK